MANIYVRSTDGSDADNGTTWALAKATVAGAAGIDAAGDTVFISDNHAESVASSSVAWAGTAANPVRVIVGDDAAAPPTAVATSATLTTTGTTFSWTGSCNVYGLTFINSSASAHDPSFNGATGHTQVFTDCNFRYTGASSTSRYYFGTNASSGSSYTEFRNCTFRLGNTNHRIGINRDAAILGGSWASGGTSPTGIFVLSPGARGAYLVVDGFDFSNLSSSVNLVQSVSEGSSTAIFRNCLLPASWTGSLLASGAAIPGTRIEMWNCDSADTNYRVWIEDYQGSIKSDAGVYKDSFTGSSTPHSLKMTSSANVSYMSSMLVLPDIFCDNSTVGSSVTATVEILHDGATALTDAEMWLECMYTSSSSSPLGAWARGTKADILASATTLSSSSETWTGDSGTGPNGSSTWNILKITVSFTPQNTGYIIGRVYLAKPSYTVYVDPEMKVA